MMDKGSEEADPKQLEAEKEHLEAMEEQEAERKEKHRKFEESREKEMQRIRNKVRSIPGCGKCGDVRTIFVPSTDLSAKTSWKRRRRRSERRRQRADSPAIRSHPWNSRRKKKRKV